MQISKFGIGECAATIILADKWGFPRLKKSQMIALWAEPISELEPNDSMCSKSRF